MATAFHFDGTDMSGSTYGCVLERDAWEILAAPQVYVQSVAQAYGGVGRHGGFGSRNFSLPVVVIGTSRSDLLTKLDSIKTKLNPAQGEKQLKFDTFGDRYWNAILSGPIKQEFLGLVAARLALEFIAPDSRAYSTTTRSSPDFSITTNPQTMTVESGPTVVAGTADADCVWIIKNTSGGAVTSLTLNNTTKNEGVTWAGTLGNNEWLRITTSTGLVEKSTDSGANWTNVMGNITGSFVLPTLKAGVANSMTLTGIGTATVTLTYTARYL